MSVKSQKKKKRQRGLGNLFHGKHYMKHREWRGFRDTFYDFFSWLRIYGLIIRELVFKCPIQLIRAVFRYRWMSAFLTIAAFVDKSSMGLRGYELRYCHNLNYAVIRGMSRLLKDMLIRDANINKSKKSAKLREKTIIMDEMMPSQIMAGFPTLSYIPIQMLPVFTAGEMDQDSNPYYIDALERYGVPADVCSLPASEVGCAIEGDYPDVGKIFISSSMPCDSAIMSTMYNDRHFVMPSYQITPPIRFNEPEVQKYAVKNLKGAINFIEEQMKVKFDWDKYKEAMENYNVENEYMLRRWDINCTDYPQASGPPSINERLYSFQVSSGMDPFFRKNAKKLESLIEKGYEYDKEHDIKPKYRAIVWSIPAHYYMNFLTWAQACWGIKVVMDMESMLSHHFINTDDKEKSLIDVARAYEKMTMRSHSNGGYENLLDECWRVCKKFNVDIVIMYNHVSCKSMAGMHGLLEDQAREKGIHLIWVDHDLCDKRTASRKDMRLKLNRYMETVMKAKPIDPTLLDYDDELIW